MERRQTGRRPAFQLPGTADSIVRGTRLNAWKFDQLDLALSPFASHSREVEGAAYLDLSEGYESYRRSRRAAGSMRIPKVESLYRKLKREAAEVHFEYHSPRPELVSTLVSWKSAQFRETGLTDVLASPWTVKLLDRLLVHSADSFSVVVSALYAGSRPIAISYALATKDMLHGMFIGYDREFSRYSPGSILLLEIARGAAERGIRSFQLGSGGDHYKRSLASGQTPVGIGSVEVRPLARLVRRWPDRAPRRAGRSTQRRRPGAAHDQPRRP